VGQSTTDSIPQRSSGTRWIALVPTPHQLQSCSAAPLRNTTPAALLPIHTGCNSILPLEKKPVFLTFSFIAVTRRYQSGYRSVHGTLNIEGKPDQLTGSVIINGTRVELASASMSGQARRFRASFPGARLDIPGTIRVTASLSGDELFGWAEVPGMDRMEWTGKRTAQADGQEPQPSETRSRYFSLNDIRPAMEYGRKSAPEQPDHVIVRNATIWTMGAEGILENADLLIRSGVVADVGYNLQAPSDAVEIDANGKHITPGLIDAHLHSGIDGVNEFGNATLIITTGNPLEYSTQIKQAYIEGRKIDMNDMHRQFYERYREKVRQAETGR